MRAEGQVRQVKLAKDMGGFVGFAGISVEHVLEQGVGGTRNGGVGDHAYQDSVREGLDARKWRGRRGSNPRPPT